MKTLAAMKVLGLVFPLQLMALGVRAQPSPPFAYEVPPDCPNEQAFVSAVAARGSLPRRDDHDARRFEISITQRESGFAGTLRVHSAQNESAVREVTGASCAEVFNALAVVAAIALQPDSKDS